MIEKEFLKVIEAKEYQPSKQEKLAIAIQCLVKAADILEIAAPDSNINENLTDFIEVLADYDFSK